MREGSVIDGESMRKFGHGKRVLASVREELDMIREVSAIEGENKYENGLLWYERGLLTWEKGWYW